MKKRIVYCLAAASLLSIASCSDEHTLDDASELNGQAATVKISLGIEGSAASRADERKSEISDGSRATTLIYAIYKNEADGSFTPLSIPGVDDKKQVTKTGISYPYQNLSFDLVRGFEYTLVFWAQSETKEGDSKYKYYDTSDFETVKIIYDDIDNNDEWRDAFCARYVLKVTQNIENVSITLKRPFAQVNVGITKSAWDLMDKNKKTPSKSGIVLAGLCDTYNLLTGKSVYSDDSSLVEANFGANTIPFNDELNSSKFLKIDLDHDGRYSEDTEQFHWVSMSYILVPDYVGYEDDKGETIYSTTVNLKNLDLNYDEYNSGSLTVAAGTLNPDPVDNLPVLRNHRTNLILDGWPFVTAKITVELCPDFDGDILYDREKDSE